MKLSGPLFVLLGSLCFSFSGTFQSLAPEGASPFTITEARMVIGAFGLFLFCFIRGKFPSSCRSFNFKYILFVALSLYAYQLLFFSSVLKTGVAVGTVVSIGSTPIWTAIVERIFFKKTPSRTWYVATALAILGMIFINIENIKSSIDPIYLVLPVIAGLCFCGEIIFAPKAMEGVSSESAMAMILATVALMNLPAIYFHSPAWILTAQGMGCALGLGLITAALAFAFFFSGVRYTKATVASTLGLGEPMGAAFLGIFFLNEPCSIWTVAGIILILLSILVLTFYSRD